MADSPGPSNLWALGDYPKVAENFVSAGEVAVEAAGISSGDRVLDVACGAGNATIPAARTGASVTGLDLTPELLDAARKAIAEAGVEAELIEADAGTMPFEDGSFDRVISVFGCMFVPDHRQAAAELARMLPEGGRLAVLAWTPEGVNGRMFSTCGGHMPPPPDGFQSPIQWGDEDHVREIFNGTGVELEFEPASVVSHFDSVDDAVRHAEEDVPPIVAAKAMLEAQGKWEGLRADLIELYSGAASPGEDFTLEAEYLVAKGSRPA